MRVSVLLLTMLAMPPAHALSQGLVTTMSLTAEAGYLTNTYLHPVLPVWVATDTPFVGAAPTASLAWSSGTTYASGEGSMRVMQLTDRSGLWWMGKAAGRLHRSVGILGLGIDGSISRIEMGSSQWFTWGGPYATLRLRPRTFASARLGVSNRRYGVVNASSPDEHQYVFAAAQLSGSVGRWNLGGHVYGSRDRINPNATSLGVGGVIERAWRGAFTAGLEGSLERFGHDAHNWKSSAYGQLHLSNGSSLTFRLGTQQFVGRSASAPDMFAAIAFEYQLVHRQSRRAPQALWTRSGDDVVLRFNYSGDGELYLVGDFNNWQTDQLRLRSDDGDMYTARLSLEPGTYSYKIMAVKGDTRRWLPLPDNALQTEDGFGGTNGILFVE